MQIHEISLFNERGVIIIKKIDKCACLITEQQNSLILLRDSCTLMLMHLVQESKISYNQDKKKIGTGRFYFISSRGKKK